MSDYRNLLALGLAIQGRPPAQVDWRGVVSLANRALLTPSLAAAVARFPPGRRPPEDVLAFLDEVAVRNRERNARLVSQLSDIVEALAAAEVECTLLKGAAFLVEPGAAQEGRMISDLDVQLHPADLQRGVAALESAGFRVSARYPEDDSHVATEMIRDTDVGALDLHRRPPGPRQVTHSPLLAQRFTRVPFAGGHVRIATPEVRILHLAMHDQFHDGGHWSGALDLRHLLDIRVLGASGADWSLFSKDLLGGLGYRALCRQVIDAHEVFGAEAPSWVLADVGARLHHRRTMAQLRWPLLRAPLSLLTLAAELPAGVGHYWRERRLREAGGYSTVSRATRARGRLARLRGAFQPPPTSKI